MNEDVKLPDIKSVTDLTGAKILGIDNTGASGLFKIADIKGDYKGIATPDDNPGTIPLASFWVASTAGPYPHFGNVVLNDSSIGIISWDGENFSIAQATVNTDAMITSITAAVNGNLAPVLSNFSATNTYTFVSESYNQTTYASAYWDTTSTFSGWDSPIGNPQNFDRITFNIRTRSASVNIIWVRIVNASGTVLGETHLTGLAIPTLTAYTVICDFTSVITNAGASQLRLQYMCDQAIDRHGLELTGTAPPYPVATYPAGGYFTSGSLNWTSINSGGSTQRVVYCQTYLKTVSYLPATVLVDNVKAAIPGLPSLDATNTMVGAALQYDDVFTGTENFARALASLQSVTSTFSGWGTAIGNQTNFNAIIVPIKARATAITSIYWELRSVDRSGTILKSGTLAITVPSNTSLDVMFKMGATIANTGAGNLWFGYKCNQFCDVLVQYPGIAYPSSSYGATYYTTSGDQTVGFTALSTSYYNMYCKVGVVNQQAAPTTAMLDRIQNRLTFPSPVGFTPTATIILNSQVYALEGKELNIYFSNIIQSNMLLSNLEIDVTCSKGSQYERFWRYTPVAADAGSTTLTITVSYNESVLATYNGNINTAAIATSSLTRKFNFFGDSTLSSGQPQSIIITEQTGDPLQIAFQGTQGTSPNLHEGRGGWTIGDYAGAGRTFYKFNVTGLGSSPGIGDVYSNNSSQFTVREVNIVSGTGYFSTERTAGSNNPLSSGILTKVSGTGPASISFGSTSTVSGNPLWNGTAISYANYLTNNSITMSSGDWFAIHLGINDVFGYTDDTLLAAKINTMVTDLRAILTNVHAAVSGIRCAIMITIPPCLNQDGFGANYGSGQTMKRYLKNIQTWQKRLITEFDNSTETAANNYLVPFIAVIDREYNYNEANVNANARNTTDQVKTYTNGVHPAQVGYNQLADQIRAFVKYKL